MSVAHPCLVLGLVVAALALCLGAARAADAPARVWEVATPRALAPGAPRPSDVCFSSRWKRPMSAKDPYDTFAAAKAFHATRLDWVYTRDPEFVAEAHRRGYRISASINSTLTDTPEAKTREKGRAIDAAGELVALPWMKGWGHWIGCPSSPEYREVFMAHARACLGAGADALQVDDPQMTGLAVRYGACFCPHCTAGFRAYLREKLSAAEQQALGVGDLAAFDYRALVAAGKDTSRLKALFAEFHVSATRAFHREMRAAIDRHAGRHVPMSCNNTSFQTWTSPCDLFDYGMSELMLVSANPKHLWERVLAGRALGKTQIVNMPKLKEPMDPAELRALTRKVIATSYALGACCIVPWDVWIPDQPRYFGTPEEYADLYGFVRASAAFLDGHEDAATTGRDITDERYPQDPPVRVEDGADVYTFTRAVPGQPDAPVVIHLVDWAKDPRPFRLVLNSARLFGDRAVRLRLLTPAPYAEPPHEAAERDGRWEALSRARQLQAQASGGALRVEVPALSPWGLLVIEPR